MIRVENKARFRRILYRLWIATEVFLKWPQFFLCGSKADVVWKCCSRHPALQQLPETAVYYPPSFDFRVSGMGRSNQRLSNAKADRAEFIAASQDRAGRYGSKQSLESPDSSALSGHSPGRPSLHCSFPEPVIHPPRSIFGWRRSGARDRAVIAPSELV